MQYIYLLLNKLQSNIPEVIMITIKIPVSHQVFGTFEIAQLMSSPDSKS